MPRPALVLVLGVSAVLLAFGAAATAPAPFHSPSLAGRTMCPQDSSVRHYKASWNEPGETGIAIACIDDRGVVQ